MFTHCPVLLKILKVYVPLFACILVGSLDSSYISSAAIIVFKGAVFRVVSPPFSAADYDLIGPRIAFSSLDWLIFTDD